MRHLFFIIGFFMMIASSKNSSAQGTSETQFRYPGSSDKNNNNKAVPPERKKTKTRLPNVNATELNSFILSHKIQSEIRVTAVNIKAARDFASSYPYITDPKWFRTDGGYLANFLSKGIFTKNCLRPQGQMVVQSIGIY